MKNLIATIYCTLGVSMISLAQPDVQLEGTGAREIEPAYRIALTPKIIDTVIPTAETNYPLLILKYNTESEVDRINPASIKTVENLSQLYSTYIRVGAGLINFMPLGEVYYDSKRSRKYVYGAHVKHLSYFGKLPGNAPAQFDRTGGRIYGGINEKRYTLHGDVRYANRGLHYYGISDTLGFTKDSIAQRYSDFGLNASFTSHKKDSATLNYKVGLDYNNYLSQKPSDEALSDWRARENFFGINSTAWYKQGKETYAADLNINYNGYKYGVGGEASPVDSLDSGIVLNNTVITLRPTITTRLWNNRFKAKVGLDLTLNVHDKTRAYIYPLAEVKYSLFNDIFIPYAGIRGGLKQNTFKGLTRENEFLLPNVNMLNEHKAIDFYGGIKGTLSKRISFNAGISFANIKDKALFVTDTLFSVGNKFDVIFDTMNVTTIEGSISYQMSEKLKVDGIAKFYSYNALNNSYAWNLPNLQVILRGSYNLFDKFLFNLDLDLEQGRRALVYEQLSGVTVENNQFIQKLNFIADANLGIEYRYSKRISAFLNVNNIASQRYQRWFNYPTMGIQTMLGATFRL